MTTSDIQQAADLIADAAVRAAEKVAAAAKSAVDSAASAASAASSASQILGAVAISRLDGIDKQFSTHERLDENRFAVLTSDMKEMRDELKDDIKVISIDLKRQTRIIALITGSIVTLSKAPDLLSFVLHH